MLVVIECLSWLKASLKKQSRLINKYLKHKTEENCLLHVQQRNKRVSLLRKPKMNYYGHIDEKDIPDNNFF